ncbi:MAG: immunoglobulin domain-containing protein, partial [Bacteroidetes bacterium]|nr:immunoglobulin domain-containing protein [Bacteroidota bacterium]
MNKLIFIFFFLSSAILFAQGEANNWFFGQNAGINFNGGKATTITGSLSTLEGCASFSNRNGDLLFYTDGKYVWDRNNRLMPNGNGTLKGHPSSTQSAIIVPNPKNDNQYYIFTVGAIVRDEGEFGLHYYIVDMTQNAGLGDVIISPSNSLSGSKSDSWTEKVTSVKGADCNTFWIISLVENTFYSFKIDDVVGLNTSPIKSTVNYVSSDRRGYLKASPNGEKLASATFTQYYDNENNVNVIGPGKLHLYNFNDNTGKVSVNGIEIISNAQVDGAPYGVEFSALSTKLYCSTFDGNKNKLYQFDLENANSKTIIKSQTGYRGALQLAPNGKIYATVPVSYNNGTNFLDAINSPDEIGANCNYQSDALNLGSGMAMQGLPPFIASLLLPIEITSVEKNNEIITNQTLKLCVGSDYTFNAEILPGNPTYSWFHNGVGEVNTTSSFTISNVQLNDAGIYELEVNLIDICGFPIIYKGNFEIEVYIPPSTFNTIIYDQCDIDANSIDGETLFNLETKLSEITNNDLNLEVLFYESQIELDNNLPISDITEYTASNNTQLLVKVTNKLSGCYTIGSMELNVYPTSLDSYDSLYTCENDIANSNDTKSVGNGLGTFDFENKRQSIYSIFTDPNIEVQFFENTSDAQLQINPIAGINDFPNIDIFVRISNKTTNNCISVGKFSLIINPIPLPKGNEEIIILCVNNPRDNPQLFTEQLDGGTGVIDDTYQWYLNGNLISGASNSTFDANAEGNYTVEVTHKYENNLTDLNDDSYCDGYNTFNVVESNFAAINQNDLIITDDSTNNSIKIDISNQNLGLGDYEYMLVDDKGTVEYQYQIDPY